MLRLARRLTRIAAVVGALAGLAILGWAATRGPVGLAVGAAAAVAFAWATWRSADAVRPSSSLAWAGALAFAAAAIASSTLLAASLALAAAGYAAAAVVASAYAYRAGRALT